MIVTEVLEDTVAAYKQQPKCLGVSLFYVNFGSSASSSRSHKCKHALVHCVGNLGSLERLKEKCGWLRQSFRK
jgi:hypothetical protein